MKTTDIPQIYESALQHYANGRWQWAEAACRQVLAAQPRHAAAVHLLGALAHQAGYLDDAIGLMRRAIACDPQVAAYHSNLGAMLAKAGRADDAASACRHALALDPALVDAHYNLGNALRDVGAFEQAADAYRRAVALRPDFAQAHNNLGNVLRESGRLDAAATSYRAALRVAPGNAHARSNLANCLAGAGLHDEALAQHRQAVAAAPADPQIHSNLILHLHHRSDVDDAALLGECRLWNDRHAQARAAPHDVDPSSDRPLRIGYVSADLRTHAVASFLLPLLRAHDRAAFHVTCYPTVARGDAVSARLRAASDRWTSLAGLSDEAAAQRIRDDGIDILVDLGGHTRDNRLQLFAHRPAPIQATWLGFPGTTGVSAIDYRITDAMADPPDADCFGSERLLRIADSGWCFAPLIETPAVAPLPALRIGYPTFGSFNKLEKIAPDTLRMWVEILQRLPDARLLMKCAAFRDPEAVDRIRQAFAAHGVASTRLDLIPDEPTMFEHLQRYAQVDVALDSFPYHGTTTTCEALWMGVPVVTLAGSRHASRVGASLLTNVGLPESIASRATDYVQRAAALAADLPRLAELRQGLRHRMQQSRLMDADGFARRLEAAYRSAWHDRA